jgi:hypothetical protein
MRWKGPKHDAIRRADFLKTNPDMNRAVVKDKHRWAIVVESNASLNEFREDSRFEPFVQELRVHKAMRLSLDRQFVRWSACPHQINVNSLFGMLLVGFRTEPSAAIDDIRVIGLSTRYGTP